MRKDYSLNLAVRRLLTGRTQVHFDVNRTKRWMNSQTLIIINHSYENPHGIHQTLIHNARERSFKVIWSTSQKMITRPISKSMQLAWTVTVEIILKIPPAEDKKRQIDGWKKTRSPCLANLLIVTDCETNTVECGIMGCNFIRGKT